MSNHIIMSNYNSFDPKCSLRCELSDEYNIIVYDAANPYPFTISVPQQIESVHSGWRITFRLDAYNVQLVTLLTLLGRRYYTERTWLDDRYFELVVYETIL